MEPRNIFYDMENFSPPTPKTIEGTPTPAMGKAKILELELAPNVTPKLSDIAKIWSATCTDCNGNQPTLCCAGGKKYDNNCAHFLSDALIRCGFKELVKDDKLYKCDKANCRIPNKRRPIRAREMWEWFQRKAITKHEKIQWDKIPKKSGWWAAFQLSEDEYWGGHVIVIDTDKWVYYGTCSYAAWDQYIYQW